MSRETALIDADGLIYIISYCKQKRDENGMPLLNDLGHPDREEKTLEQCQLAMDDIIKNILLGTGAEKYILFLTIGKNFRYKIYPEYKANRKYGDKPQHFDDIKTYLLVKYLAVHHPDLEADDLCLIYRNKIENSFICSPDKDMVGLEGTHYNYNKGEWITVSKDEAHFNFWSSVITGDTADNIKGIPGKGPAAVKKIIGGIEPEDYMTEILLSYVGHFGEEVGISEFNKNYQVLKIKGKYDLDFVEPIKFEIVKKDNEQTERDSW